MSVTLHNPRTGKPKTFPSQRSASVYERKGWTKTAPKSAKSAQSESK